MLLRKQQPLGWQTEGGEELGRDMDLRKVPAVQQVHDRRGRDARISTKLTARVPPRWSRVRTWSTLWGPHPLEDDACQALRQLARGSQTSVIDTGEVM